MELQRAIMGVSDSEEYLGFWPVAARAWRTIVGIEPTIAVIGEAHLDESLGTVIRFPQIQGVSIALHSQVIRLLLPALFPEDVCITTDIDILPLSRSYFRSITRGQEADRFVVCRDGAYRIEEQKYPMCYVAARGSTFAEIFGIERRGQIEERVREWNALDHGWSTDELVLFSRVQKWSHRRGERLVRLGHTTRRRLDRSHWRFRILRAWLGLYVDAHLPRPFDRDQGLALLRAYGID